MSHRSISITISDRSAWAIARALDLAEFPPDETLTAALSLRNKLRCDMPPGTPVIDINGDPAEMLAIKGANAWVEYPSGPVTVRLADISPDWDRIEANEDSADGAS